MMMLLATVQPRVNNRRGSILLPYTASKVKVLKPFCSLSNKLLNELIINCQLKVFEVPRLKALQTASVYCSIQHFLGQGYRMALGLYVFIFDATYGSRILSLLLFTFGIGSETSALNKIVVMICQCTVGITIIINFGFRDFLRLDS